MINTNGPTKLIDPNGNPVSIQVSEKAFGMVYQPAGYKLAEDVEVKKPAPKPAVKAAEKKPGGEAEAEAEAKPKAEAEAKASADAAS